MQRPLAYSLETFLTDCCEGTVQPSQYFIKRDGFRLNEELAHGGLLDTSKRGLEILITDTPHTYMEAVLLYKQTHFPLLTPYNIKWGGKRIVRKICFEFVATRKGSSHDCLQAQFHKECLDPSTGKLNEEDFTYSLVIIDIVVNKGNWIPRYFKRMDAVRESLIDLFAGTDVDYTQFLPEEVSAPEDIMQALLTEEGLVMHRSDKSTRKIKLPKVLTKMRVIAVGNALKGFHGFTHFLMGVPDEEGGDSWRVIHAFDWTPLFADYTRAKEGRSFINQHSVRVVDGLVTCDSRSTLQPMVNALFRAVSGVPRLPPMSVTKTTAKARFHSGPVVYKCGINRSFSLLPEGCEHWEHGFEYLTKPVDVILGAGEVWLLHNSEIHFQPAWLLAVYGQAFGHPAYKEIAHYTPLSTIRDFALNRWDVHTMYARVGMVSDPFLGMEKEFCAKMTADKFCVPYDD